MCPEHKSHFLDTLQIYIDIELELDVQLDVQLDVGIEETDKVGSKAQSLTRLSGAPTPSLTWYRCLPSYHHHPPQTTYICLAVSQLRVVRSEL